MSEYPALLGDVHWCISRTCESGACIGVARYGEFVLVGNPDNPEAPVCKFTVEEWNEFLAGAKLGDFDHLA